MMFRSSYIVDAPRKQVNGRPLYENMLQGDTAAVLSSEGGAVLSASSSRTSVLKACPDFSNPSNGCSFRQIKMCPSAR